MKLKSILKNTLATLLFMAAMWYLAIPAALNFGYSLAERYTSEPSQSEAVQTAEVPATIQAAPAPAKTLAKPSGKTVSISNPKPNITFSGPGASKSLPVLVFGKKNTIVFRDVVTSESVAKLQQQLIRMSQQLAPSQPIYLVLDTPGGSVDAGLSLVDTAKGLPQEVKTVTFFAASMGYHIVESLGERLIVPSGTLMSHRVRVQGIEGQVPGEAVTRLNQLIRLTTEMDEAIAKRIGMSLKDYQALIQDEYWVQGQDSVNESMADKVVLGRCGEDLNGTYEQNVQTLFGAFKVTWSECPLISGPVAVDMGGILKSINNADKKAEFTKFIEAFFWNKKEFTRKYIMTREFTKILAE